ncbi:MAG: YcaO-like family protein [Parcubacteria group bacterium]|nr:YcaO-like family protein [Parcubacteria group bacterium]
MYKTNKNEFLKGVGLADYFDEYFDALENPFSEDTAVLPILKKIGEKFAYSLESFIGNQIYIKKQISPLDHVPPKFRRVVARLAKEGIITDCYRPKPIPDWPNIPALRITCGGLSPSGCSLSYEEAAKKAVAECFERHSFTIYDNKKFIYGSYAEFELNGALDPKLFSGFSKNQLQKENYARHRLDDNSKFMWTEAKSLFDNKKCLVPAQLIYLGYKNEKEEPVIRQTTTSGAAAGSSYDMALYNALCEAVERDSFVIHWLNKITPPRINLDNIANEPIRRLLSEYKKFNIDFAVFDITTDLNIPAVLTVIRDNAPKRLKVYAAPRADLDIENAIKSSLSEALVAGFINESATEEVKILNDNEGENIKNIKDRIIYWSDLKRIGEADFLYGDGFRTLADNKYRGAGAKEKLPVLKEILKNSGLDAYVVDATTPLAKEFGLTVLASLIPRLCPLYLNEHYKCLGVRRLYEAPARMGIFKNSKKEEEMNLVPHPML